MPDKQKLEELIIRKIAKLMLKGRIISTWDLIREKNFHLNTDLIVIDKQELRNLVLEVLNENIIDIIDDYSYKNKK